MDIVYETAVSVIEDYKERIDDISECYGYDFKQRSYSKWTADEILRSLYENHFTPPLVVIENFKDKMKCYSQFNIIFSIAYDTAQDIIELF